MGTAGNVVAMLSEVEKVLAFVDQHKGGVTLTSDRITYPKGLQSANSETAPQMSEVAVSLAHINNLTDNDDITFVVKGDMGFDSADGVLQIDKPVIASTFIDFGRDSGVFGTTVDLKAVAGDVAVGTPDAPRVQFFLRGMFSSLTGGECEFTATLEIDNQGHVFITDSQMTKGDADISLPGTIGALRIEL